MACKYLQSWNLQKEAVKADRACKPATGTTMPTVEAIKS
jgi:hypothetical protein